MKFILAMVLSLFLFYACDSSTTPDQCAYSNSIVNPNGSLHGEPCEKNEDCKYGICKAIPSTGEYKVCTKICNCGENSTCSEDDDATTGRTYFCYRPSVEKYGKVYYCIPSCKTSDFCKSNFADFYNSCGNDLNDGNGSVGITKGCLYIK